MLLETEHLTKDYNGFRALDDLHLQVGRGEIFGLLGPNGSGKSTTLRLLLGFLRATQGWARIGGHDCWYDSVAVRRQVAYLPGELRLYENMTGQQLLHFLEGLRGQSLGAECDALAKRFDIDLQRPIANLSSGMKRKLALLQVLLPKVPLLILDEPTNTLDPTMRDELLEQLRQAKAQGQTVLFSSHVLQEVERVCDRVGILCRGRLVHLQPMQELRATRLARVRFAPGMTPALNHALPPGLSGVTVQGQKDGELTLVCHGDLQPLLQWLAGQAVADLRLEPQGLGAIYRRYHGEAS
jgi:ABC-2 type transport system ATP-binding protein